MRRLRLFALVSLVAVAMVGCGDSSDSADSPPDSTAADTGTVRVADSSVGKILVDARGMTLYLFTKDSEGKSVCEAACASLWPPLMANGTATAGKGVDGAKLSTITRPDGSSQVAYGGRPLYFYAKDTAAGQVTGQGVGGVWFAVRPDGSPASADSTKY
jgi:predicted lipoprotein with Yx(FWY)xxD motif